MNTIRSGGCLCGSVRFQAHGVPLRTLVCHCKFCQRMTGTTSYAESMYPTEAVQLSGLAPSTYEHRSQTSSKTVYVHFCPRCGSTVSLSFERWPQYRAISRGAFDDPDSVSISSHIWTESAQTGVVLPAHTDCFRQARASLDGSALAPQRYASPVLARDEAGPAVAMVAGFIPWPVDDVARWTAAGYREGRRVADVVLDTAKRLPGKVALVEGPRSLTYSALVARMDHLASALLRAGLKQQDRVVMQLPNSIEFVVTFLALMRIGAIPVMALRAHRFSEVRHFVQASGAVAYFVPGVAQSFDYRLLAQEVQRDCPGLARIFVMDDPLPGQHALRALMEPAEPPALPADASADAEARAAFNQVKPDHVALMLLSGGTTAMSKLIPRTHDDYVLNARLCAQAAGFDENTVFLALLPLGHNYNLASPGMLGAFYFGGSVVIGQGMDAEQVFPLVESHGVTVIAAAVPLITQWLNADIAARHDLRSLRVVQNGGARLAPELRRRIRTQWGATPQEIYGTAEGLINMTRLDDPDEVLFESSGSPVCADDDIKVVDDEGREVADGELGELLTRGPYTIRAYFNAPDKNAEAFTEDGFYRMGDYVRKRGRTIYAEGRKKDLINRGGEKISCEEVENLIFKHPKVQQVALVAMPDPVFGEKACAFVVAKPGEHLGFAELIQFLKLQRIASFKLPERLELVDHFPTSLVGKILKRQLREQIAERMQQESKGTTP